MSGRRPTGSRENSSGCARSKGFRRPRWRAGLGLKQPAIARLESGTVTPTLDTIQRVAQALGRQVEVSLVRATARKKLVGMHWPAPPEHRDQDLV
jgi:hypothetical protein